MEQVELLKEIGLSKVQAKIYLELLVLKKARVMDIYRQTKIARSNIYHNLKKLKKQKLVKEVVEGKQKFYSPENPRLLLQIFSEKEKLAKELAREIGEEENGKIKKPIRIYSRNSPEAHVKCWRETVGVAVNTEGIEFALFNNWEKHVRDRISWKDFRNYVEIKNKKNINFRSLLVTDDYRKFIRESSRHMRYYKKHRKKQLFKVISDKIVLQIDIAVIKNITYFYSNFEEDFIVSLTSDSVSRLFMYIFNYFWKRSKKPEEIEEIKNLMVTGGGIEPPT